MNAGQARHRSGLTSPVRTNTVGANDYPLSGRYQSTPTAVTLPRRRSPT